MARYAGEKLNRKQAAEFLGVNARFLALDAVTGRHKVPYYKVGRRCVYSVEMLEQWLAERVVNAPAAK